MSDVKKCQECNQYAYSDICPFCGNKMIVEKVIKAKK